ncbi:uncharacterized protein G2W53_042187 [Senna tora]|uniref:Uncharacterized protein n=1 Tax=Senna tora TaxID=362788 RepID=A0A834W248_9FABA|nr:uncharacterized protein G2W53_042187 [Senna tora]
MDALGLTGCTVSLGGAQCHVGSVMVP